ncbi:hypothetical protein [Lactiplantibacillus songbeiensis]|uniref:Uncharacterized protein n=1 Tax=Lactiplantibacillus songbeiensis TaxID=2559920 RepID=A0ABW4C506_9LACO|nr:hypothetical protein [Lactiplantibacillus songbeiensis]
MSLNKLVIASLAGVSLLGGLVVTSTPAMAKSKTFKYYDNNSSKHYKKYQSMNKYTLNKKFTVRYSGTVKINHIYVFHVSPMRSKYQTWVKVSGRLTNNSTGRIALGKSAHYSDSDDYYYVPNSEISLATSVPLKASKALSFGPIGDSWNDGLGSHYWEKFDLILHTKSATSKLGASTLKFRTSYEGETSNKVINTTKTIKLNLN